MGKFQEMIAADMEDVFFDRETFGSSHLVDDKELTVVVDNQELDRVLKSFSGRENGVYQEGFLCFIAERDIGRKLKVGSAVKFDHNMLFVHRVRLDDGVYRVVLGRDRI